MTEGKYYRKDEIRRNKETENKERMNDSSLYIYYLSLFSLSLRLLHHDLEEMQKLQAFGRLDLS